MLRWISQNGDLIFIIDQTSRSITYLLLIRVQLENLLYNFLIAYLESKGMQIYGLIAILFFSSQVQFVVNDGVEKVLGQLTPYLMFSACN